MIAAYIQAIMSMQQEVQHVVMGAIQDVSPPVYALLTVYMYINFMVFPI